MTEKFFSGCAGPSRHLLHPPPRTQLPCRRQAQHNCKKMPWPLLHTTRSTAKLVCFNLPEEAGYSNKRESAILLYTFMNLYIYTYTLRSINGESASESCFFWYCVFSSANRHSPFAISCFDFLNASQRWSTTPFSIRYFMF